jgi:hypothetical protein
MTANGFGLGEGGDFTTELDTKHTLQIYKKTVMRSTKPPLLPNRFYAFALYYSL